ncbi:MAG TPA: helix-turn-helix transcriptional regulator [Actinocrinis sp.]|nr:helix-turn-helix transcriptional regulator [Actinocrinis sp.]
MTHEQTFPPAETDPVYVISAAAELSGLHPQTLRQYDRLGLVSPDRTAGRGRRYSLRDIERLREVQRLSQEEGVNLAGIKRIRELEDQVAALQAQVAELSRLARIGSAFTLGPVPVPAAPAAPAAAQYPAPPYAPNPLYRADLLPAVPAFGKSTALVVWKPRAS